MNLTEFITARAGLLVRRGELDAEIQKLRTELLAIDTALGAYAPRRDPVPRAKRDDSRVGHVRVLFSSGREMTVRELLAAVGGPRGSMHAMLHRLRKQGLVICDPETGKHRARTTTKGAA